MRYSFNYNENKIIIESNEEFLRWYNSGVINDRTALFDEELHRKITVGELTSSLSNGKSNNENKVQENDSENKNKIRQRKPIIRYILFGVSIVIGTIFSLISNYNKISLEGDTTNSAFNFGRALGDTLIYLFLLSVFSITIFKFFKDNRKINICIIVNIVIIIYFFGGTISSSDLLNNDVNYQNLAQQKVLSIAQKVSKGERLEKEKFDSQTYGQYVDLLNCSDDYYLKLQSSNDLFNRSLKRLNLSEILNIDFYTDNKKISDTRQIIKSVIESYDIFGKDRLNAINEYINNAEKINIPNDYKESFIAGIENSRDTTGKLISEYNNSQKSIWHCLDNILKFLQSLKGKYEIKDGEIVFNQVDNSSTYNKLVDDLNKSINYANGLNDKMNKLKSKTN